MFYSLLRLDEGSATDGDEGPALDTVLGAPLVSAHTHTHTHTHTESRLCLSECLFFFVDLS